jgi:DNA-binding XRE family transcriptional regulator
MHLPGYAYQAFMSRGHAVDTDMPARHNQRVPKAKVPVPPSEVTPEGDSGSEPKLTEEELQAIGKRVKAARELKDMSQTALADEVGIAQNHMSRIEGGKRQPSLAVLFRISRVLGQPVGWIAADEGAGPVARPVADWTQRDQRKRRNTRSQ